MAKPFQHKEGLVPCSDPQELSECVLASANVQRGGTGQLSEAGRHLACMGIHLEQLMS